MVEVVWGSRNGSENEKRKEKESSLYKIKWSLQEILLLNLVFLHSGGYQINN